MKILTVREPWATLIIRGARGRNGSIRIKDIENRTWEPSEALKGERIAIHAGLSRRGLRTTLEEIKDDYGVSLEVDDLTFGAVIGSVRLAGWVADSKSPWFQGPVGLVLKEPFAYPKAIPCRGWLGFFANDAIEKTLARYERGREK